MAKDHGPSVKDDRDLELTRFVEPRRQELRQQPEPQEQR